MHELISVCLALMSVTDGLHCIVCSTATDVSCEDPHSGDMSITSSLSNDGFIACLVSDNPFAEFYIFYAH